MEKSVIKLNESQLRNIIMEAVKECGSVLGKEFNVLPPSQKKNSVLGKEINVLPPSQRVKNINEKQLKDLVRESLKQVLSEKAVSVAQRNFMGMVDAYKKGDMPDASPAIKKAAKSMTSKEVKDFAKTKHKGLPDHVDESKLNKVISQIPTAKDHGLVPQPYGC